MKRLELNIKSAQNCAFNGIFHIRDYMNQYIGTHKQHIVD
ncbi:hypothetical protein M8C21_019154 [Ambrosia artemisiifolia]|uniref:Uncharacterized protein n=1 Tax=Ambrosia artemisiifolia TaxID=4212 RepID=A0AAD5BKT6_AMBAR|nr:hypothetical protein M8C21_019154 [Ambrosia artemisiifolia]